MPGPAVELAAAKMADPAADLPVPTAAPASSVAPTLSTGASVSVETAGNHNSDEMDKLDEQLEALEKLKDILAQEAIDAAKQVIATRMQSLNRRAIAVLQGKLVALETVDGELSLEVFQETKQKILDKLSALGVTDATAPVQTSVAPDSVALQPSAKLEPPVATTPAPAPNGRKSDHDNTASSVLDIVGRLAAGKHHGIQFGDRRGNGAVAEYQCVVAKNAPQACSTWASADRMRAVVMRGGRVFFGICNICSAIAEAANIPVGQMTFQQMLQLKNSEPVQGIDVEPMLRLGPGGKPVRKTGKTEKKRAKRVCVAPVDKSGDQFPKPQKKLTKEERAAAKRAAQGK
ncbi:MAG: hypothetical protein Q7S48_03690 [bacterium]|nr:hypothetical protein [bacterium]